MGRSRVSAPKGRTDGAGGGKARAARRKEPSPPGLRVVERGGYWHIHGTLRVDGHSKRIRKSTELPAEERTRDDAEAIRHKIEATARRAIIHGVTPSAPVAVAADLYLADPEREKPLGEREVKVIEQVTIAFGDRWLDRIPNTEWLAFVASKTDGRAVTTKRRWLNALFPFLKWCLAKGYLPRLPSIKRPKIPRRRRHTVRRRVKDLRPDLIEFLIAQAAPHLQAQLWVEWSTGARVSSILFNCRLCDVVLAEGREQITFHDTKNGEPVTAALHPRAAAALRSYLELRGRLQDREGALFLDHRHQAYSPRQVLGRHSGTNRTAFNGMKRRAILLRLRQSVRARRAGDPDLADALKADARLLRQVTQHWFRHAMATTLLAQGADLRSIMAQGGWRDPDSVLVYAHDVPDVQRRHVLALPVAEPTPADTTLTQAPQRHRAKR